MSAQVPIDGRAFWPGTNGTVPADWLRDTDYDDKFPQGGASGFTGATNGGSASPTHTADAHGLTAAGAHVHNFSAANLEPLLTFVEQTAGVAITATIAFPAVHKHNAIQSAATAITYQDATPTLGAADNPPPFIRMIVIKPNGAEQDIPDDVVCFTADTVLPTEGVFTKYAAANGRFFRGAEGGADGGGTGGSATHSHSSDHTHTVDGHYHAEIVAEGGTPATTGSTSSPTSAIASPFHHKIRLANKALSDLSTDSGNVDAVNGEPAYVELLGIRNTSGAAATPLDVIVGYVGTEVSLDSLAGWELVASTTDRQIRCTGTDGDVGNTGGSNDNTHTTSNHLHTHGAHNHSEEHTYIVSAEQSIHNTPTDVSAIRPGSHNHIWTVTSTTPATQNNTFTMSTDDGRFPYRTMIFIKRIALPATVHIKGGWIKGATIAA